MRTRVVDLEAERAVTWRELKPPKRWTSWRVCPRCGSRATKLFSLNTGMFTCQICENEYSPPEERTDD